MATWEDGPEYAPRERPQYFADAPVPPLEQAPRPERPADGLPADHPRFDQPSAPVAPLAELVPTPPDERDPNRPFDVVTATLTSESAWGSPTVPAWGAEAPVAAPVPSPDQPFGPSPVPARPGPAPTGAPWPGLEPPPGSSGFPQQNGSGPRPETFPHAAGRGPYPEPGTPDWFTPPPPAYGDQPQPGRTSARAVFEAATPGLCICLALGGLVLPLSPVLLAVAVVLSTRVRVAQAAVRMVFRVAGGAVAFFAVIGLYRSVFVGDSWWGFVSQWSVAICWLSLVALLLIVWQALRRPTEPPAGPPAGPPPLSGPWG